MTHVPQIGQSPLDPPATAGEVDAPQHQAAFVAATQEMLAEWGDVLERLGTV